MRVARRGSLRARTHQPHLARVPLGRGEQERRRERRAHRGGRSHRAHHPAKDEAPNLACPAPCLLLALPVRMYFWLLRRKQRRALSGGVGGCRAQHAIDRAAQTSVGGFPAAGGAAARRGAHACPHAQRAGPITGAEHSSPRDGGRPRQLGVPSVPAAPAAQLCRRACARHSLHYKSRMGGRGVVIVASLVSSSTQHIYSS